MLETAMIAGGGALAASIYYYMWGRPTATPQFGVPLEAVHKGESGLPVVVDCVLQSLRQDGMRELGVFRQSGSRKVVRELKEGFDAGKSVSLEKIDVHTRGDLLKLYLRELPDPVFPYKVFNLCMDVEKRFREDQDMQRWIASTKCIVDELPAANYVLLRELCYFLNEVAQYADVNAMGGTNLATCFGPNLLTTRDGASLQELLELSPLVTRFTLKCLENAEQLFEERRRKEEASTAMVIDDYEESLAAPNEFVSSAPENEGEPAAEQTQNTTTE